MFRDTTEIEPLAVAQIDRTALDALRTALPGRVLIPEDVGYDAARAGYSIAELPTPDVVVVAADATDVIAAVRFARDQQLPIGVKATGHNFGFAWPGGLMINTERMQGVQIGPLTRTARIAAGVRWRDVITAAAAHGLAPLSGSSGVVGVVGYTLSGGFGWLLRKYGAAVDSVLSAEIVTADGQLRRVNPQRDPDLFWALCGGGGNFGVVTALEFQLYPVATVYGGALFFPIERAAEVLSAWSAWVATVPETLTSTVVLQRIPPLPSVPEALRGKAVVTVRAVYCGQDEAGAAFMEPLRKLGGVMIDTFVQMPYHAVDSIANDPIIPMSVRRTTALLPDVGPGTIATLLDLAGAQAEQPLMLVEIRHLGGAMTRIGSDSAAFSQRDAPFLLQTIEMVPTPAHMPLAERKTQQAAIALQPHTTGGVMAGWLGSGDYGVERTSAGYTSAHYARLRQLKQRYDPANIFRLNHNIPPTARDNALLPDGGKNSMNGTYSE